MAKSKKIIVDAVQEYQDALAEPTQLATAAAANVDRLKARADDMQQTINGLNVKIQDLTRLAATDDNAVVDLAAVQSQQQARQAALDSLTAHEVPAAQQAATEAQQAFERTRRHAGLILNARVESSACKAVVDTVKSLQAAFTSAAESTTAGDFCEPGEDALRRAEWNLKGWQSDLAGLLKTDAEKEAEAQARHTAAAEVESKRKASADSLTPQAIDDKIRTCALPGCVTHERISNEARRGD